MVIKVGQIVHYRLTKEDAATWIAKRRNVEAGDTLAMIITKVASDAKDSEVNGQVFLPGDGTLPVVSFVGEEDELGTFSFVEGVS